jgi:hypothetical protein
MPLALRGTEPIEMPDPPADESSPIPLARRAVLPYQAALPTSAKTVRKFNDVYEAQLFANQLAAHGIDYYLMNRNTNILGAYSGFSLVELQVREQDAIQAEAVLSQFQINPLEIEPAEETDATQPISDPAGEGMLVAAAAFDNPRSLYDAAATLGAAHIESFLPMLVARGDRPAGTGNRFVLRVREGDGERATELLARAAEEEAEDGEPRCPRCGSYRIVAVPQFWRDVMRFIRGDGDRSSQMQCLRCQNRWTVDSRRMDDAG